MGFQRDTLWWGLGQSPKKSFCLRYANEKTCCMLCCDRVVSIFFEEMMRVWMHLLEAISYEEGALMMTSRGTLLVGIGHCRRAADAPGAREAFYFPDFFLEDPHPWFIYDQVAEYGLEEAAAIVEIDESVLPLTCLHQTAAEQFKAEVVAVQTSIAEGKLSKAVPYMLLEAAEKLSQARRKRAIAGAITHSLQYGSSCYGFWGKSEGMIGATPELLASWQNGQLSTVACAGTALDEALLYRAKEQYEHALVIEGLRETLAPYGIFEAETTRTIKAGALYHLLTPVKVQLDRPVAWSEVIPALHPTPALGAYPQASGKQWLRQYAERYPRHRYGAPVGYRLPCGEQSYSVAIRQLQWNERRLLLAAGCGVTADSSPEAEWLEAQAKVAAIRTCLGV
jgi:isochorismate synthase EntC